MTATILHCPECHEDKPLAAFGRASWRKSGFTYRCRHCNARRLREWAHRNSDKAKAQRDRAYRKWREKNPIIVREPLMTAEGRLCRTCGTRKPLDAFAKAARSPDGIEWRCRTCAKTAVAKWIAEHPYRSRWPGVKKDIILAMWTKQNGRCAICERAISITVNRRHGDGAQLDHCHKTGSLRELLCAHCNTGLGGFRDNPVLMLAAIEYLKRYATASA